MYLRTLTAVSAVIAVAGCATAPDVYDVQNTRFVPASKDVVWERVVEFFATNNLSIKTIEKDSGIVAAERLFGSARGSAMNAWASCGSGGLEMPLSHSADLNVFVRPKGAGTTITVNTRFNEVRQFADAPPSTVSCNSKGVLEQTILDAAGAGTSAAVDPKPYIAVEPAAPSALNAPKPVSTIPQPAKAKCGMIRQADGSVKRVKC